MREPTDDISKYLLISRLAPSPDVANDGRRTNPWDNMLVQAIILSVECLIYFTRHFGQDIRESLNSAGGNLILTKLPPSPED